MSLTVKFYNVEHGSCTHVITPNGKHLLYDIGSKTDSSICGHLKSTYFGYGGRPDMLAITHPHIDHLSDLCNMYRYDIKPGCLWRDKRAFPLNIIDSDRQTQIDLKNCANRMHEEYSSAVGVGSDPEDSAINGGVAICRYTPNLVDPEYADVNNFSCVNVIEYGGFVLAVLTVARTQWWLLGICIACLILFMITVRGHMKKTQKAVQQYLATSSNESEDDNG